MDIQIYDEEEALVQHLPEHLLHKTNQNKIFGTKGSRVSFCLRMVYEHTGLMVYREAAELYENNMYGIGGRARTEFIELGKSHKENIDEEKT